MTDGVGEHSGPVPRETLEFGTSQLAVKRFDMMHVQPHQLKCFRIAVIGWFEKWGRDKLRAPTGDGASLFTVPNRISVVTAGK